MKLCIVSDSHDRGPMLARAIEAAAADGAEAVIHCGDLIGGNTLKAALKLGLQLVQFKLGQVIGDPSFSVFESPSINEMPMAKPISRTAKIQPPRIVTTR